MDEKYDLSEANLSTIQSLIASEQHRLVSSEGMGKGPAYYKACESVGKKCIRPDIGGPELASWIGVINANKTRSNTFRKGGDNPMHHAPDNHNGQFMMPDPKMSTFDDNDPYLQKHRKSEGISEKLRSSMRMMTSGMVIEYEFGNQEDARKVQRIASHVAKAERWPRLQGNKPSCKTIMIEKVGKWVLRIYKLA